MKISFCDGKHYSACENNCMMLSVAFVGGFVKLEKITLVMSPGLPWLGFSNDTF